MNFDHAVEAKHKEKKMNMRTESFALLVCLLAGCANPLEEEESVESQSAALQTVSASYAGGTQTVPSTLNGIPVVDPVWLVNQSDALQIISTRLTATINHDGGLTAGAPSVFGHIAIGIRGCSFDAALQQMSLPLQTGTFVWGEDVAIKVSPGNLYDMTAGRGITFWPKGSKKCTDPPLGVTDRPCARFENYAEVPGIDGLMPGGVGLNLTSAPFQVVLSADDWDTTVKVTQGGVTMANVSCRAIHSNNPQCGAQPYNVAMADAFIAFANEQVNPPRTVGAVNIQVTHTKP